MFPTRIRRLLADLVDAADVVLAYEAPVREGAREVAAIEREAAGIGRESAGIGRESAGIAGEGAGSPEAWEVPDRHALRRARTGPRRQRRPGAPATEAPCTTPR